MLWRRSWFIKYIMQYYRICYNSNYVHLIIQKTLFFPNIKMKCQYLVLSYSYILSSWAVFLRQKSSISNNSETARNNFWFGHMCMADSAAVVLRFPRRQISSQSRRGKVIEVCSQSCKISPQSYSLTAVNIWKTSKFTYKHNIVYI